MASAGQVGEALSSATDALRAAGAESPRLDAELLLAEAMGVDRAALAAAPEAGVDPAAARSFGAMVRRRVRREPVAYILGRKGFRRIELAVDRRGLIPRPETELLVELALEVQPATVLDVGTGSGAIALAVADELPDCEVIATDTSSGALALAAENAARLGFAGRMTFLHGTLPELARVELLLANLPYVTSAQWAGLAPEITRFEPRSALVGGEDGLEPIRSLVASLGGVEGGESLRADAVGFEVGAGQAPAVAELLGLAGFETEVRDDLAGIGRCVVGRRR